MEMILSPSLLAADFANLASEVNKVERAGAQFLHLDVMDGVFVPNISFGIPVIESLRKCSDLFFDVHLMIQKPENYIEKFINAGADLVTFHIEATDKPRECIAKIKSFGKKVGIAISPKTPAAAIYPYIDEVDMILCMAVEPGYGGQKYMPEIESKVLEIRKIVGDKIDIEVDGGISAENVMQPVKAGANVIVAGTAVFKGNIEQNVKEIMQQCVR